MHELKSAIKEASSVLLMLSEAASDIQYLAARQIQKIAPEKIHLVAPDQKETFWQDVLGGEQVKKELAIVVDTSISPVDELRYERENGKIVIYLAHQKPFRREAIRFEEHLPAADLILTLGFRSQEAAEKFIESAPRKLTARHIWLDETASDEELSWSKANLLGRLLARSRQDSELDTLWSFITKEDFSKTSASQSDIPDVTRALLHIIKVPKAAAIFWQSPEKNMVTGFVWSENSEFLKKIARATSSSHTEKNWVLLPDAENFVEAERQTRKLLREIS